jgi:hypothetical protein
MTYAEEREYSPRQKALVILEYIHDNGTITVAEAMRETGLSCWGVYSLMLDVEGAIARVRKEGKVWVYRRG